MTPLSGNFGNADQQTDLQNALKLCAFSELTNPGPLDSSLPGWNIVWDGGRTTDGNYAFIAADLAKETYVLTIAGSLMTTGTFTKDWDFFANWVLEDFNVLTKKNWPYATTANPSITDGAYLAFQNLQTMQDSKGSNLHIAEYLANAIYNEKRVIITGHSLGGLMANVFASYFISTLTSSDYVSLYTFAAPAAGNGDFATDLDAKLPNAWHYQCSNDIIPNFPVAADIKNVASMYTPQPLAANIPVTRQGNPMMLDKAILLIRDVLLLYGYKQQARNYTILTTDLNDLPNNEGNTFKDWLAQAGSQHVIENYAAHLAPKQIKQAKQFV